jgi:hypothetical protein
VPCAMSHDRGLLRDADLHDSLSTRSSLLLTNAILGASGETLALRYRGTKQTRDWSVLSSTWDSMAEKFGGPTRENCAICASWMGRWDCCG